MDAPTPFSPIFRLPYFGSPLATVPLVATIPRRAPAILGWCVLLRACRLIPIDKLPQSANRNP